MSTEYAKGTSINDVSGFLVTFDLPSLTLKRPIMGAILDPPPTLISYLINVPKPRLIMARERHMKLKSPAPELKVTLTWPYALAFSPSHNLSWCPP